MAGRIMPLPQRYLHPNSQNLWTLPYMAKYFAGVIKGFEMGKLSWIIEVEGGRRSERRGSDHGSRGLSDGIAGWSQEPKNADGL